MKTIVLASILLSSVIEAKSLVAGPMLGHVAMRGANIWVQSPEPGEVGIVYWPSAQPGLKTSMTGMVDNAFGHVHTFKLKGLEPNTQYSYQLTINNNSVEPSQTHQFTTQDLWHWRHDPPDFSFLAGSCNFENDKPYDRPGKPYGSDHEIFEQMASEDADMMLWLGDNWYYHEVDYDAEQNLLYRALYHKSQPHLQKFFQQFPHYATWDDHDFGPDNSGMDFTFKEQAMNIFKKMWANPSYGMPEAEGIYTKFRFSDVEFFLMDSRYHRANENMPDGPDKPYHGTAQMSWLKNQLRYSKAPFKFIVGGGQMLNDHRPYEGWQFYRHERDPFLEWLHHNRIEGVMFLSGDIHHTEMLKVNRPNAYPLYEMTCSPLTAGVHADQTEENKANPLVVKGSVVAQHNYCQFSFSGPRKDRRMRIEVKDKDGKLLWQDQIKASVLSYAQINDQG